jgi:hypothetical protein
MKIKFITYSSGEPYYTYAENLLNQSSEQFDDVSHYNSDDIKDFKSKNQNLWNYNKGDGFWTWKPYVIKKELEKAEYGDIIVYCDTRYIITGDIYSPIKEHFEVNSDEYFFVLKTHHFVSSSIQYEHMWSKGDAFNLIGVDINDSTYPYQIWSGFVCLRKNNKSVNIINQWLDYCQDERIVTDNPNIFQSNHPSFRENRYDQTVLSLVLKKNNIFMKDFTLSKILSGYPHSSIIHRIENT